MKGYLQSLPAEIDSIHVRPADTFGAACSCPVDAPYGLTDQVMRFTNRMAHVARQVRPDMEYPYVAYQSTWAPPPQVPPGPGVNLSMAPIHRCYNHAITDPNCWVNASYEYDRPSHGFEYGVRPILEEHMKCFDPATTFVVDYWVDASFFGRGRFTPWECRLPNNGGIMQKDIQYYHSLGIPSIWTFVVFIDDHYLERFTSPLIFQYGELLWNPEADLRAGLRDFCRHYYGEEELAELFPLDEPSDPRDITAEIWYAQIERVSAASRTTRAVMAAAQDDVFRERLNRLMAEQERTIAVMRTYGQQAAGGN